MHGTEDILGHDRVIARLWSAMSRDALHHAYLFEGRRGVGKHLVAQRLAMASNCTGDVEIPPCGTCPTCRSIAAGNHPDVIPIGLDPSRATPTISVDQVREVVRKAGYHRYGARRRFVIVDPADAMPASAANALLKILEEPPDGTGFVLVTSRASALLPTILSRCQRVRFSAVPEEQLAGWLEDRDVAEPVLVARLAQGCPGAALALADGGLAERRALRQELLEVLAADLKGTYDWSTRVCRGRRQQWMERVEQLLAIVEDLLRDVVVMASDSDAGLLNADTPEVVSAWTDALWPRGVETCTGAIDTARDNLDRNVNGRLLVDSLLTRLRAELGGAATPRGPARA